MRKIILILVFTFLSCSDDDNSNCLAEKQKVIDQYDELIQMSLEDGDEAQAEILRRDKEIKLNGFDC